MRRLAVPNEFLEGHAHHHAEMAGHVVATAPTRTESVLLH